MEEFNPDKCYLTKQDILGIGDTLIDRWNADSKSNRKMIIIAKGLQFLLKHSPASAVEQYYREAFKMVYFVMQKNARAGDETLSKLPMPEPPAIEYVKSETPAKFNFLKLVSKQE